MKKRLVGSVTDDSEMWWDRPVDLTLVLIDERNDGRVKMVMQSMTGWWEDREDISRPAWKTTVFFLHPESSWRFRKSPLAVSFTWKLASESLGDHNIVPACSTILLKTWLEMDVPLWYQSFDLRSWADGNTVHSSGVQNQSYLFVVVSNNRVSLVPNLTKSLWVIRQLLQSDGKNENKCSLFVECRVNPTIPKEKRTCWNAKICINIPFYFLKKHMEIKKRPKKRMKRRG